MSNNQRAREPGLTLANALQLFASLRPPRLLMLGTALAVAARIYAAFEFGAVPGLADLLILGGVILAQPFVEWVIHVFILHQRPFHVAGIEVDLHAAKHHRAHHLDPWDLRYTVMPIPAAALGLGATTAAALWLLPLGSALTLVSVTWFLATLYEWTHFLIHTSYRPRTLVYRRLWKLHRLHHFKNETLWFGVTRTLGDRVLGTTADPSTVPKSPTAKTLHRH